MPKNFNWMNPDPDELKHINSQLKSENEKLKKQYGDVKTNFGIIKSLYKKKKVINKILVVFLLITIIIIPFIIVYMPDIMIEKTIEEPYLIIKFMDNNNVPYDVNINYENESHVSISLRGDYDSLIIVLASSDNFTCQKIQMVYFDAIKKFYTYYYDICDISFFTTHINMLNYQAILTILYIKI